MRLMTVLHAIARNDESLQASDALPYVSAYGEVNPVNNIQWTGTCCVTEAPKQHYTSPVVAVQRRP